LNSLNNALIGRSHRSKTGRARLAEIIDRSRDLLGIPQDWKVAIVPASDTGAFEMALWSMLGERGIDALAWENFGQTWVTDLRQHLKLTDIRVHEAPYGLLPDLSQVDCDRDVIFPWTGTASGVTVPNGDWIADERQGLTFCDATSAIFAVVLPWRKLDVVTWSWQKVLGGEAAHGMLALSPRAVERLERYTPPWPLPKIFRLTENGKLFDPLFQGETINTPSMLAVEDCRDSLVWAEQIGGLPALIARTKANYKTVADWVETSDWAKFLAEIPNTRSTTALCLSVKAGFWSDLTVDQQQDFIGNLTDLLAQQGVAYDIAAYRSAPPGLRLWGGATVETSDLEALLPWLDWGFGQVE
jgi:phosphoserine aminotransferase